MNWFVSPGEMAEHEADAVSRMGAANGGSDGVVKRLTGNTVPDPFTQLDVPEYAIVHTGPTRLGSNRGPGQSRTVSTPGGQVTLAVRVLHWPNPTPTFRDGDLIELTAGASTGTTWVVVEADRADQQAAYRVPVTAYRGT